MTRDAMLPYRLPGSAATQANTFAEGVVLDVTPAGLRFTLPSWDGGKHVFGPAPWPVSRVQPALHSHPDGSDIPRIFVDQNAARAAVDATTTIDGVVAAWNNGIGKTYGITMRAPKLQYTRLNWVHTPLTEANLATTRIYVKGMISALACYPPKLVVDADPFARVDLIAQSPDFGGWALPDMITVAVPTSYTDPRFATFIESAGWQVWHHELMHIWTFNYNAYWQPGAEGARSDWLAANPVGFVYSGVHDTTGPTEPEAFANQRAPMNYFEDTAETVEEMFGSRLFMNNPRIRERIETDLKLQAKVKILSHWFAAQGMTSFSTWFASSVPAAWHGHSEARPVRGARVLVLFIGEGIERPWVLGWW